MMDRFSAILNYLDWEMKVEQIFACHHISEERKFPLATLSFQEYALYWWTSLLGNKGLMGILQ